MKKTNSLRAISRSRRRWLQGAGVVSSRIRASGPGSTMLLRSLFLLVFATLFCTTSAFAAVGNSNSKSQPQTGTASWHAPAHNSHESRTASGKRWVTSELVAAHRHLPLGSRVAVTHLRNNRSVIVQIIDRGPYIGGRIIDLSQAAARELGLMGAGTGRVRLEALPPGAASRVKKALVAHVTLVRRAPRK